MRERHWKQKTLRCILCGSMVSKKPPFKTKHQKGCEVLKIDISQSRDNADRDWNLDVVGKPDGTD